MGRTYNIHIQLRVKVYHGHFSLHTRFTKILMSGIDVTKNAKREDLKAEFRIHTEDGGADI